MTPPPAVASIDDLNDDEWGAVLWMGEGHMSISVLQVSGFIQAIGNDGVMCSLVAFDIKKSSESWFAAVGNMDSAQL